MKGRAARCRVEYRIGHWKCWAPNSHNPLISGRIPSTSMGPQFSPFVGGNCPEGWGEDTCEPACGCPRPLAGESGVGGVLGGEKESGLSQDL